MDIVDKSNLYVYSYTNAEITEDSDNLRFTFTTKDVIFGSFKKILCKYEDGYEFNLLSECKKENRLFFEKGNKNLQCWFPESEIKRVYYKYTLEVTFIHKKSLKETTIEVNFSEVKHITAC